MATTRTIIDGYFDALRSGEGWQAYLAEDLAFTSLVNPARRLTGRDAYLAGTAGFFGMVRGLEVREVLVDGDRACVMTRYTLHPPVGEEFVSDVAEVFTVRDGRVQALSICFDTAPYPS